MIHTYRRIIGLTNVWVGTTKTNLEGEAVMERTVQPGWPHGDAWGEIMRFPESHDTERHRETLRKLAEKKGNSK